MRRSPSPPPRPARPSCCRSRWRRRQPPAAASSTAARAARRRPAGQLHAPVLRGGGGGARAARRGRHRPVHQRSHAQRDARPGLGRLVLPAASASAAASCCSSASHGIDLVQHLLGPIADVSARTATLLPERRLADGSTRAGRQRRQRLGDLRLGRRRVGQPRDVDDRGRRHATASGSRSTAAGHDLAAQRARPARASAPGRIAAGSGWPLPEQARRSASAPPAWLDGLTGAGAAERTRRGRACAACWSPRRSPPPPQPTAAGVPVGGS